MTEIHHTPLALLRRKEVEREVGLSRSTIYERIKAGTFPAPVKLGLRAVGWRVADIDRFLSDPTGYRSAQPAEPDNGNSAAVPVPAVKPRRGG